MFVASGDRRVFWRLVHDASSLSDYTRDMLQRIRSLLLLLVMLVLAQACATAPPRNPENICSIFKEKRGWHKTAVSAEKKWGSSMHIPMAFMYQESAFQRKARPPRRKLLGFIPWRRVSSAYGYAQAINGTWRSYIDATGEHWRFHSLVHAPGSEGQWHTARGRKQVISQLSRRARRLCPWYTQQKTVVDPRGDKCTVES